MSTCLISLRDNGRPQSQSKDASARKTGYSSFMKGHFLLSRSEKGPGLEVGAAQGLASSQRHRKLSLNDFPDFCFEFFLLLILFIESFPLYPSELL